MSNYEDKLDVAESFNDVFEIVKKSVEESIGLHRAGLTLVLVELPNYVGAYHQLGSNAIVMNKTLLNAVASLAKSRRECNSYTYMILLHEYLHSLGYVEEEEVRPLVNSITRKAFGEHHVAAQMASQPLTSLYPELRHLGSGRVGVKPEIIKNFDESSAQYIK